MSTKAQKWFRDLLVLPIVVALVAVGATYVLPRLFSDQVELSYSLNGPTPAFIGLQPGMVLRIDNVGSFKQLYRYRITIWNSGDEVLKEVPVSIVFDGSQSLVSIDHATIPEYEFGQIRQEQVDSTQVRFIYALLNPGDRDEISVLATSERQASLFSKAHGMQLLRVEADQTAGWVNYLMVSVGLISVVASILTAVLQYVRSAVAKTRPSLRALSFLASLRDQPLKNLAEIVSGTLENAVSHMLRSDTFVEYAEREGWTVTVTNDLMAMGPDDDFGQEIMRINVFLPSMESTEAGLYHVRRDRRLIMNRTAITVAEQQFTQVKRAAAGEAGDIDSDPWDG